MGMKWGTQKSICLYFVDFLTFRSASWSVYFYIDVCFKFKTFGRLLKDLLMKNYCFHGCFYCFLDSNSILKQEMEALIYVMMMSHGYSQKRKTCPCARTRNKKLTQNILQF